MGKGQNLHIKKKTLGDIKINFNLYGIGSMSTYQNSNNSISGKLSFFKSAVKNPRTDLQEVKEDCLLWVIYLLKSEVNSADLRRSHYPYQANLILVKVTKFESDSILFDGLGNNVINETAVIDLVPYLPDYHMEINFKKSSVNFDHDYNTCNSPNHALHEHDSNNIQQADFQSHHEITKHSEEVDLTANTPVNSFQLQSASQKETTDTLNDVCGPANNLGDNCIDVDEVTDNSEQITLDANKANNIIIFQTENEIVDLATNGDSECSDCENAVCDNSDFEDQEPLNENATPTEYQILLPNDNDLVEAVTDSSLPTESVILFASDLDAGEEISLSRDKDNFIETSKKKENLAEKINISNFPNIRSEFFREVCVKNKQGIIVIKYQCLTCFKYFETKIDIEAHMKLHSHNIYFECYLCKCSFLTLTDVKQHMKDTHSSKKILEAEENKEKKDFKNKTKDKIRPENKEDFIREVEIKLKNGDIAIRYQCLECFKYCENKESINMHMLTHTGESFYECYICDKRFSVEKNLNKHLEEGHKIEHFQKCMICQTQFSTPNLLHQHLNCHTELEALRCNLCSKIFIHEDDLKTHKEKHKNHIKKNKDQTKTLGQSLITLKPLTCDICSVSFTLKTTLRRHMQSHKIYRCSHCDADFSELKDLNLHALIHVGEKRYQCDTCQKSFSRREVLITHLMSHTDEKNYQCDHCGKLFKQLGGLNIHRKSHLKIKPFQCLLCGYSCVSRSDLSIHMRTHTGERPYCCDVCGLTFKTHSYFSLHRRKHTGERPYKCDVCSKGFSQKSFLKNHCYTHTHGHLRPYPCPICDIGFVEQKSLKRHMKRYHPGNEDLLPNKKIKI